MSRRLYSSTIVAALLCVLGATLLLGGLQLLKVGGSTYYAAIGGMLLACAAFVYQGSRWSRWLYLAIMATTLGWALSEVGLNGWALAPKVLPFIFLGLWFMSPSARRALQTGPTCGIAVKRTIALSGAIVVVIVTCAVLMHPNEYDFASDIGIKDGPHSISAHAQVASGKDWLAYGSDAAGTRFSELSELTPSNVSQLQEAWVYRTGPTSGGAKDPGLWSTPLKINASLYFCTAYNDVIALDAETGKTTVAL